MKNSSFNSDDATIKELASAIKGQIILPGDPGYEEARKVYNAMIDKHPAIIVKCNDAADVIQSVNFARKNNLLLAVRGGGHNGGGLGICDDGMVIDLSLIKYVQVNQRDNTVRGGGGNTFGEVDHATHAFGLAVPAGVVSTTGVGGLTLGGGIGHLSRKYGLTIDNLLEVDMVLADGTFVTGSESENSDLFWAVRGGGGNFGIVTSFKFQAYPVTNVYGGPTLWPIEMTEEIMEWYDGFLNNAPDDLNGFFAILTIPGPPFPEQIHNKKFCGVIWCYSGVMDKAAEIFKPILAKNPAFQHVGEMPYPMIQTMFDGTLPPGLQWYWRADFFNESNADLRKKHLEFGLQMPTPLSQMHLYPISGTVSKVAKNATPWPNRNVKYASVIVGVDPDPANAQKITKWSKEYWEAIHPYSTGGGYLNFMMDESQDRVRSSYKENYERLTKIKRKYDPDNLFQVNQNIIPAKEPALTK